MPQSQITFLDSGMAGPIAQQTVEMITQKALTYAQPDYEDVIMGIELLNEPIGWQLNNTDLRSFYRAGFERVRLFSDVTVVIQDGFLPPSSYNGFLTPSHGNAQHVSIGELVLQVKPN
jgi:glucan 1,3-beta-glucosidase